MNSEAKAILTGGRDILIDPDKWGKSYNATNKDGKEVLPTAKSACRFCAYGVLRKARHEGGYSRKAFNLARKALKKTMVGHDDGVYTFGACYRAITIFNDTERTTHGEVIECFDKAIQSL